MTCHTRSSDTTFPSVTGKQSLAYREHRAMLNECPMNTQRNVCRSNDISIGAFIVWKVGFQSILSWPKRHHDQKRHPSKSNCVWNFRKHANESL